ncbi:4-hydroxy-tetrahydrodipicolinate reductase [Sediminitomix flava]|uniref:4-hydroxy-tetrahydrodipicolinate reductase n=1 Tax=Sediminitomix flava TaxID=379075 RepID=A0A315Z7A9_SEDFL|nr:4-hydroxy-tetrahydrodipicolinate reductase [Sediminitomix flava]PWJ40024.1 dihydrodipicolinate reductase [Sediminitomix flava]
MNVLIVGYGKMGQTIEKILIERGHNVVGIVDRNTDTKIEDFDGDKVDIAIEFTQPSSAFNNISSCLKQGIKIVSGTTGWLDRRDEIEKLCADKNGAFFYASNFSLGVNLFFQLNKQLAELMKPFNDYGVSMEEIHHTEKLDEPSGTAITLAEGIIEKYDNINDWYLEGEERKNEAVGIKALREPHVPGTHTIRYTSELDEIEIKHTAHTRTSFALGAVVAAEWAKDRQGILSMDDMLKI